MGLASACARANQPGYPESLGLYAGEALILGGVILGPTILLVQWALRGRRASPSAGEWLWLAQTGFFAAVLLGTVPLFVPIGLVLYLVFGIWIQGILAIWSVVLLLRLLLKQRTPPCRWTDILGSVLSGFTGILFIAQFSIYPLELRGGLGRALR
jgi:hypothetical protein